MNRSLKIGLWVAGGIVALVLVLGVGLTVASASGWLPPSFYGWMHGWNHASGYPMMGNGYGGMMGNGYNGGYGGLMGGFGSGANTNASPLTIDQARQAVDGYLNDLNDPNLKLAEIMVFDNNAYARIVEKSTGVGAMELLVDPATLAVFPEYGPNMMWNLKYGHMSIGNGMMGGLSYAAPSAEMPVDAHKADQIAQEYLDQQFPGYQVADDPDPFYGYYTIDILKDGKPTGMLSVNGYSGQVFLHTWHGTFIDMFE